MTPPLPPCRVDNRFTASRAHKMLPVTLTAIMRWMRSADISSTREVVPTMPALLTSAPSVPNLSAALNNARISLSLPTSHFTAIALPFLASIALFLLGYLGLVISTYPYLVPPVLTFWEAAAAPASQIFLLLGTIFLLPIILGYYVFIYWLFQGKVREGEGYH